MLWRRRIPTYASCQGSRDECIPGRYIACRKILTVARARQIAAKLGWVDHVVWPGRGQEATIFYAANATVMIINRCEGGVLLLPRVGAVDLSRDKDA